MVENLVVAVVGQVAGQMKGYTPVMLWEEEAAAVMTRLHLLVVCLLVDPGNSSLVFAAAEEGRRSMRPAASLARSWQTYSAR